jgi:hypothetical protein
MPSRSETTRRTTGGKPIHLAISRLPTGFLPRSYHPDSAEGDKRVFQGMILAEVSGGLPESDMTVSQPYYVPYSVSAAYGVGSDTAVGILEHDVDATYSDWQITPVDRGTAFQKYCYEPGGPYNSITAAVKTDLADIKWRDN